MNDLQELYHERDILLKYNSDVPNELREKNTYCGIRYLW